MDELKPSLILAVDLDNTLIKTDMINVGIKFMLKYKIYLFPKLLWILLTKGKPHAKKFLYDKTAFSIKDLAFNNSVVNFIKLNKDKYQQTILISGSYYKYVNAVATYTNLFDSSVGTTEDINMVSLNKVEYLNNKYGKIIFDYIGDSIKDIPIWEVARTAYVVKNKNILNHIRHINYQVIS
tara:strand:+ start:1396 stop:1938 length:543 start_codon:yes stop_codon:yes gene_type:complete